MFLAKKNFLNNLISNKIEMIYKISDKLNLYNSIIIVILGILYKIALDSLYVFAVTPQEAYTGLIINFSYAKYLQGFFLYYLVFLMLPRLENKLTTFFLHFQFAITVAPMLTYYSFTNNSAIYMYTICFVVLLQNFILRPSDKAIKTIKLKGLANYTSAFMIIFIPISLFVIFLWSGFEGLKAFDFAYLYEMRKYAEAPPLFGYIINWLIKVIIPFYILLSLYNKKYLLVILLISADFLLYMMLGWKIIYLSLFIFLGIYFLAKIKLLLKGIYFGLSVCCLISIWFSLLEKYLLNTKSIFTHIFGARFLFGPAFIKFQYYDFFSEYPFIFFSDGLLGKSLSMTYLYAGTSGQVIYSNQWLAPIGVSQSNTGYLGDSYAQLGFIGVIIMSILLAYIIKFISEKYHDCNYCVLASSLSLLIVVLNDNALFTTILTGGMIVLIILLMIYGDLLKDEKKGENYFV